MPRQPSYPKEAAIGAEAVAAADAAKAAAPKRTRHLVTGAAIGIGSAAIVAALLYANRSRKNDR